EEYNTLKKLYDTIQDAKKSSDDQLSTFSALIKEKEKANVLLLEKLHELEGKVKDAEQLREENADLSRQINALLLNQKEKEKELMSFQKKMDEMENEIEKAKADLMAARSDRANMEKELSSCKENLTALKQELAICEKEAALKQEQAVISKEREMYHKTEELQKKLDETKEENYKLRLTIARFDNPDKRNEDRNHETN
ncbi:MAG: hypothetical protein PUH29_05075, partial [Lachnospiraceae bacterium]|nr:hypothetical protein [Lachnospiraceae bacterium]